jgi:hypothetical protein
MIPNSTPAPTEDKTHCPDSPAAKANNVNPVFCILYRLHYRELDATFEKLGCAFQIKPVEYIVTINKFDADEFYRIPVNHGRDPPQLSSFD